MEIEQLRALKAVVDGGTFEAAARALHVTPSAVSQRIKSLEQSLGRTLVQRSKPVVATQSGIAVLRLARQIDTLTDQTRAELNDDGIAAPVSLAVNADSMATWVLPVLAPLASQATFDLHRQDQDRTAQLLHDGIVSAAITSVADPVRGCTVRRLGAMRYRPSATPGFIERWFPAGVTAAALRVAPVVVFDVDDRLQDNYLQRFGIEPHEPPRHLVPASADYARAVDLGFGWGMIPDLQARDSLKCFDDNGIDDVLLYWQQWSLSSPALQRAADAVAAGAARMLL
ncbi:ArgP/LysG family DNA-binding transcriptional regulator [Rhodococcus sp. 06-412-2C]|uniref:LysR family transcriptional regulator ArgP n=1 Tax=unclassified Rhodococcus (in: high G+C Gram-positive bacteria) TaxID=192944 RepID=UPI000B9A779A|nr:MULTISPECIES: LysR family transcriptional regulator ArgP [unclassified Rhodococcus (in: high G+C Gram-positive bacteria)]OZC88707.1 ArgP/LysG family DNA-binding transcriptional regulator [Rhodococcus sp. 06-412-2C]OZD03072.1 ArgP/LysG family DNA-binding transcriptional regulator [Rhodococcus sp. 06-412-2B]